MLDECKGDKFFEVLASFSTAVLKKTLAMQISAENPPLALSLSTATALSKSTQASLLPLAIAHKGALTNILKRKEEKRARFHNFERLLNAKADEINRRLVKSKATPRTQKNLVPEKEAVVIKKQLRDNWVGNQKWLDVMLHGDEVSIENAFLDARFDDVWEMVQSGGKLEDAVPEPGLLEDLQSRVEEQRTRLQEWKQFHEGLKRDGSAPARSDKVPQARAKEIKFDDHLALQLPSPTAVVTEPPPKITLRPAYQEIIAEMDAELLHISTSKTRPPSAPRMRRSASSLSAPQSPVRRRKSRSDSSSKRPVTQANETALKPAAPSRKHSKEAVPLKTAQYTHTATPLDSDATLIGHQSTSVRRPASPPQLAPAQYYQETVEQPSDALPTVLSPSSRPSTVHHPQPQPPSPSPQPSSYWPSEPPILEAHQDSEDILAEQIISAIGNATPSPMKKLQPRPSLLERTRMSMARTTSFDAISESPPESPALPELPTINAEPQLDRRTSLLERTRLSMAAMSQNPRTSKAQRDKDKRKSNARQSLYPVNQFDTPRNRKSIHVIEEAKSSGSVTPKEDLFSDDVDPERVFKSRPRVAQSPVFSLMGEGDGEGRADKDSKHEDEGGKRESGRLEEYDDEEFDEYDEGVTGVDLGDVDQEDEDGFTAAWENSPSRGAGAKGKGRLFG
jgi:hypothetical protein